MRIALFGATGMIGSQLAREALSRGHSVTAIVRDPARLTLQDPKLTVGIANVVDTASTATAIAGHDAVIAAVSGRRDGDAGQIAVAAKSVIAAAEQAGVARVLWVGGAGSLEVAPGVRLIDSPQFPKEYLAEALAGAESLDAFRANTTLDWSFLSPAITIAPGERTGKYQLGGDQLIVDAQGQSTISVEDYAVAMIDELEQPQHIRARFSVINA